MSFWWLQIVDDDTWPLAIGADDWERDALLMSQGRITSWPEVTLEVVPRGPGMPDYLANDVGLRLMSPRLRRVLELRRGPGDELQWLPVRVMDSAGKLYEYSALHLVSDPDVLDPDLTAYAAGGRVIVKPVISPRSAARHRVFRLPKDVTRLIVSADVREAVLAADCTGVNFETVP